MYGVPYIFTFLGEKPVKRALESIETKVQIVVAMDADRQAESVVLARDFNHAERFLSGLKFLAMCWGIAVISILVPILHFFLVPGFLVGGIAIFFIRYCRKDYLELAELSCPNCHKAFRLEKLSFNWPLRQACPSCEKILLLKKLG